MTLIKKIENSVKTPNSYSWNQSLWKGIKSITSAQLHFDSLVDSEENDPARRVIHKLCLHRNLQEKIKQGALDRRQHKTHTRRYKDDMMKTSLLCHARDSKRKKSKRRRLD